METYVEAAKYMKCFLDFIGASENDYSIIKETQTFSLFREMARTLDQSKEFGEDEDSQVRKNETERSFYALILYQIKMGNGGTTAYQLRDYRQQIVKTGHNNEFNSDVSDAVDDIEDGMQDAQISGTKTLVDALVENSDAFESFGQVYDDYMQKGYDTESVESLLKEVHKSVTLLMELNQNYGLRGNLHYNQFNTEQLEALQRAMQSLSVFSRELFGTYGKELK